MEVVGMDSEVRFQLKKMISASLCSSTTGQVNVNSIYHKNLCISCFCR